MCVLSTWQLTFFTTFIPENHFSSSERQMGKFVDEPFFILPWHTYMQGNGLPLSKFQDLDK